METKTKEMGRRNSLRWQDLSIWRVHALARVRALQVTASTSVFFGMPCAGRSSTGLDMGNIKHVVLELFSKNLIRSHGYFARSVTKAQMACVAFTLVFATLVSIVNTKLLMIGEVLLHRLTSQFRRIFKRNAWSVRGLYFHAVNIRQPSFPDSLSFYVYIHHILRHSRRCPRVDCSSNPRSFPGAGYLLSELPSTNHP